MISKISGHSDFQRTKNAKERKSHIKKTDEKSQKVLPKEKPEKGKSKNFEDKQNRDFFIAEYYRTLPIRLKIIESKSPDNET